VTGCHPRTRKIAHEYKVQGTRRANSRRASSPVSSPRTIPTRRSMRSSSAAADRDMKLQEASALEQELETLRELDGSKLDPDVEAEYLSRIETLRNHASAVGR
jgi:hypothetical protein